MWTSMNNVIKDKQDTPFRVVVLVSGGGTNLQAIFDAEDRGDLGNVRVCAVISNNPEAYALERANKKGVPAECINPRDYAHRREYDEALLDRLQATKADLIVLAGFLVVIPAIVVEVFANRIINIHPSLIPSFCGKGYYGLHVHEAVLDRGVKVTGATVHFVDEGTDTGPIILQKAVEVLEDDTPETLQRRVMEQAEWKLLPQAIRLIAQGRILVLNGKTIIVEGKGDRGGRQ